MTRFEVLTLFPEIFMGYLGESLLYQAAVRDLISVGVHNMRDWASDRHHTMDDRPYGGGPGMVLMPDPIVRCVEDIKAWRFGPSSYEAAEKEITAFKTFGTDHLIMLTPQGRPLRQTVVEELVQYPRLLLLCGRYEGFDERIQLCLQPDEISLGDFILNGGEVAAMAIIEAVSRLIPGVLGDELSSVTDSFSSGNRLLEAPQYTRPRVFRGFSVPEVLLNGNHQEISIWRDLESRRRTLDRRPDLCSDDFVLDPYSKKKKKRNKRTSEESEIDSQQSGEDIKN